MANKVMTTKEIGFCFGVQRALTILEKVAQENGGADTLGALVHNEKVLQKLASLGIRVIDNPDDIGSKIVGISAHGVSPALEKELRRKATEVVDTTCPSVRRAQRVAHSLAKAGFLVVIFGEAQHPEVKGILGWSQGKGIATMDVKYFQSMSKMPRKVGIISQTTQIPESFCRFVKDFLDLYLSNDIEVRVIDTICHGVRKRQKAALELAGKVELMLVIGGSNSANSKRLLELCSGATEAYLIKDVNDIKPEWLIGKKNIGVTSGTSTSKETIEEVVKFLDSLKESQKE